MNSDEMMYAARCEYLDKAYEYLTSLIEDDNLDMNDINEIFHLRYYDLTEGEIEEISLRLESEGY